MRTTSSTIRKHQTPPLVLAFSACVKLLQQANMPPYTPKNRNLPFYLHLALSTCTKLIISTLRSVGTPAHYLHTAYTKLHTAYTKLHTQLHTACTTKKTVPCTQHHNHATRSCQYREREKPIGATAAPVPLCRHTSLP